jgi:hypothetical protein
VRVIVTQPGRRRSDGGSDVAAVGQLLRRPGLDVRGGALVLLPELIGGDADAVAYQTHVQALAAGLGAWVVGGSHFARAGAAWTNRGIVADPSGRVAARYGKLNPYGDERSRTVRPESGPASFQIGEWVLPGDDLRGFLPCRRLRGGRAPAGPDPRASLLVKARSAHGPGALTLRHGRPILPVRRLCGGQ